MNARPKPVQSEPGRLSLRLLDWHKKRDETRSDGSASPPRVDRADRGGVLKELRELEGQSL